jgi:hypothetical protein
MYREGKTMKAFLIILVILVVLAGTAFYFGWVQILLPPENYAVVFTKIGGYDDQVIRPGEFSWRWERLIPTNMTLYTFDLHPRTMDVSFKGSLPSGHLYSSILPENPDFSLSGNVSIHFGIVPESLPALVAEEKLSPEALDDFYEAKAEQISNRVMNSLKEVQSDLASSATLNQQMERELAREFPDLKILSLRTETVSVPDLELYELARQSYRELVEIRDRSRDEAVTRLAVEQVRAENARDRERETLEALREYGKLLNEYPILLKAMYVQKLSGDKVITIPEFDLNTILEFSETE